MKLYLSSFELGNKTDILKQWVEKNDNKILLITNARDLKENKKEEQEKIRSYCELLQNIGFKVEILDLQKYFYKEEELNKYLKNYKAFCVIGGNVFVLRIAMKLSGFDKFLIENKYSNLLYIGWSAGSCVLSKKLNGLNLVDEPVNPYNTDEIIYDGIGFLDKIFVPHYKSDHKESYLIDNVVNYLIENKIEFDTFKDGEVLIKDN